MNNVIDFKKNLIDEIQTESIAGISTASEVFIKKITETFIENGTIDDFSECYFRKKVGNRMIQVDGYSYDNLDKSLCLFIFDYSGTDTIEKLDSAEINKFYNRVKSFVNLSALGKVQDFIDESSPAFDFSVEIKERLDAIDDQILRYKLFIISDRVLATKTKKTNILKDIQGVAADIFIWDLERLSELYQSKSQKEAIKIDFTDFAEVGLKFLEAAQTTSYRSYLGIIDGDTLSQLYIRYGAQLLEGNVRSFLSTRGKVNKGIRRTINQEPEMFFAFNNGIAATAQEIETEDGGSQGVIFIKSITDFQIINGGQTTASIANAILKDKAYEQVKDIKVPVKLSIVSEGQATNIVPRISRTANTQNKVSEADFFSSSPFHVRIEEFSRKEYAPEKLVFNHKTRDYIREDHRTRWYYERARGQYDQEQMKLTVAEVKKFRKINPKRQVIKKTDLAKYLNTFLCKPHLVSKGAQNNMKAFADYIDEKWGDIEKPNTYFNVEFYRKMISQTIIFKETELLVSSEDWYKQIRAYRANIVTYSLAFLQHLININQKGQDINYKHIWNNQNICDVFREQLKGLTYFVYEFITRDDRTTLNVTEWCKKETCWTRLQKETYLLNEDFISSLVNSSIAEEAIKKAKKDQKINNDIDLQAQLTLLGSSYWKELKQWGIAHGYLTEVEISFINSACSLERRIPSASQAKRIFDIKDNLEVEGFKYSKEVA
ncbi:AIPR family protein [Mycoplasmatota bacterium zrk1]